MPYEGPHSGVCLVCLPITTDPERLRHIVTFESLQRASLQGCAACLTLFRGIAHFLSDQNAIQQIQITKAFDDPGRDIQILGNSLSNECERRKETLLVQLDAYESGVSGSAWPFAGVGRDVSPQYSDERLNLAKSWLKGCLSRHMNGGLGSLACLPTRVIHVGSSGRDPFLYESKGEPGRYVALSYCWGGVKFFTTETSTIRDRKHSIALSELPNLFRDAVLVTRSLGLDYLWIDALCIIQDSPDDWSAEASRMSSIFANAILVLAADDAEDPYKKLFLVGDEPKLARNVFHVPYHKTIISFRHREARHGFVNPEHLRFPRSRNHLNMRAWAFQERLLAQRTLHFTAAELVWECRESVWCECQLELPDPWMAKPFASEFFGAFIDNDPKYESANSGDQLGSIKFHWYNIVSEYTQRALTYPNLDRLPALAGLAGAMLRSRFNTYLCGLWKEDLAIGLTWQTIHEAADSSRFTSRRNTTYHAPTWSWASVTGQVGNWARPWGNSQCIMKILDVHCELAGANQYGAAKAGYLQVASFLAPVHICRVKTESSCIENGFMFLAKSQRKVNHVTLEGIIRADVAGQGSEIDVNEIHYLLILLYMDGLACCLVLRNSEKESGSFERVGYLGGGMFTYYQWVAAAKWSILRII